MSEHQGLNPQTNVDNPGTRVISGGVRVRDIRGAGGYVNTPIVETVHPVDSPLRGKYPELCTFNGFAEIIDKLNTKGRKLEVLEELQRVLVDGLAGLYGRLTPGNYMHALNQAASMLEIGQDQLLLLVDRAYREANFPAQEVIEETGGAVEMVISQ